MRPAPRRTISTFGISTYCGYQDNCRQESGGGRPIPFQDAIAKDPSFAPAYAGLAEAYAYLASVAGAGRDDLAKMHSAAERAIQLDPLLEEAHDALGVVYARDGHWRESEASFRRAIQLNPNSPVTRLNFVTNLLWPLGRIDEAVQQLHVAEKADPLSQSLEPRVRQLAGFDRPLRGSSRTLPEVVGRC